MVLKKSIGNYWRLEDDREKVKVMIKKCLEDSNQNKLWWIQPLKETSFDDISSLGDSDQFCLLLMEGHFQALIV